MYAYQGAVGELAEQAQAEIKAGAEVTPELRATAYLRVPYSIARAVALRFNRLDMLEDLTSIGVVTLFEVAKQYEPAKGHFGPYVKRAIHNQITAALIVERGKGAVKEQETVKRAWELRDEIKRRREAGERTDPRAVAEELGMNPHHVQALMRLTSIQPLDRQIFGDTEPDGITLGDTIADPNPTPEEQAIRAIEAEERRELHRAVAQLSERGRAALGLATGFPAFQQVTVDELLMASRVRPQRTAREHLRRQFKEGGASAGRLGFNADDANGPGTGERLPSPAPTGATRARIRAQKDKPEDIWRRLASRWREAASVDTA